jgi:hypothetical protein
MEIWKDVIGFEGLYQVSSKGQVKSVDRTTFDKDGVSRKRRGRMLKQKKEQNGYLRVGLSKSCKMTFFSVHRLVANAFIPNPESKQQVNHINENKLDNSVANLEWNTCRENCNHGNRNLKLSKPIFQLDNSGNIMRRWNSIKDASATLGIKHQNICEVLNGGVLTKGKWRFAYTAGGYKWRWAKQSGD